MRRGLDPLYLEHVGICQVDYFVCSYTVFVRQLTLGLGLHPLGSDQLVKVAFVVLSHVGGFQVLWHSVFGHLKSFLWWFRLAIFHLFQTALFSVSY